MQDGMILATDALWLVELLNKQADLKSKGDSYKIAMLEIAAALLRANIDEASVSLAFDPVQEINRA